MQLGLKGRKERNGWGSPETGGCICEEEGGAGALVVQGEPLLPPAQQGDSMGHAGKQRIIWGQQSPRGSLVFSPPLFSRARQAAAMGKKEHSTACVSSCPGTLVKY